MPNYYNSYKGSRRRKRNRIRVLLLILLLLVVVGAAVLLFLPDRAIFTSDGLRLPFGRQTEPPEDGLPDDFELVIEGDPSGTGAPSPIEPTPSDPQPGPASPPEELDVPAEEPLYAFYADGFAFLQDPSAVLTQMTDSGCRQLALRVKDGEGNTLVPDGEGAQGGVLPQAGDFAAAVKQLSSPPAVVLNALRDNVRPRTLYRASALHTGSGAIWLDRSYLSWFDPTGKDTAANLITQINACAALGAGQVILIDFQFPTVGKVELINFSHISSRTAALTQLAGRLREGTEIELALLLTDEAAKNLLDGSAGQDVMELAQYFDLLYVNPASGADPAILEEALRDTDCRVGLYAPAAHIPQSPAGSVVLLPAD